VEQEQVALREELTLVVRAEHLLFLQVLRLLQQFLQQEVLVAVVVLMAHSLQCAPWEGLEVAEL
jgi:hypothetical protein